MRGDSSSSSRRLPYHPPPMAVDPVGPASSSDSSSASGQKSSGKRFARRAKRWAQLQQKRARTKAFDPMGGHLLASAYEYLEMPEDGYLTLDHLPPNHPAFAAFAPASGNLPYSVLIPHRHTAQPPPLLISRPIVHSSVDEYGNRRVVRVYSQPPQLTAYPSPSRYASSDGSPSPKEEVDDLVRSMHSSSLEDSSSTSDGGASQAASDSDDVFTPLHPYSQSSSVALSTISNSISSRIYGRSQLVPVYDVNTVPPPDRTWVMIRHADPERPIATFTVLCYNVLCDKYATQNLYSYCPSWALNWEYRKASILKEIRNYEADIITLQEVETEQFNLLFKPELKALGYSGIFSPKSRAKTMCEEDRRFVDGCAIFWKDNKFDMERQHLIEFTQLAIKKAPGSEHMLNRVMPKDNIALCAVLRIKDAVYNNRSMQHRCPPADNVVGFPLVVCTAHIHWDPEFCDVKLVQSMMLAHEVAKLVEEVSTVSHIQPHQCPVLVCGDLNSLPDSGVFEFLSKGAISRSHPDLKGFKDDAILEKFSSTHDSHSYTHALRLDSAIDGTVVPFTNYTLDFKGMIDYIFSTPQSLARLGVLGPFDNEWMRSTKIIGFPHPHVPSDHIPIMAQYAMIPTAHQRTQPTIAHYGHQHSGSFGAVGRN